MNRLLPVGIAGTGRYGSALARGLALASVPVEVFDVARERIDSLLIESPQIIEATSLAELYQHCQSVVVCVDRKLAEDVLNVALAIESHQAPRLLLVTENVPLRSEKFSSHGIAIGRMMFNQAIRVGKGFAALLPVSEPAVVQEFKPILDSIATVALTEKDEDFNRCRLLVGSIPGLISEILSQISHAAAKVAPPAIDIPELIRLQHAGMIALLHDQQQPATFGSITDQSLVPNGFIEQLQSWLNEDLCFAEGLDKTFHKLISEDEC